MSKVLKFGGTSVGSETNMRKVAEIIRHEQAKVTVLSAMSGTTDSLVKISSDAKTAKIAQRPFCFSKINTILVFKIYCRNTKKKP